MTVSKQSKKQAARDHYEAQAQSRAERRQSSQGEAQKAAQVRGLLKRKREYETSELISGEITRLNIPHQHLRPDAPRQTPTSFTLFLTAIHDRAPKLVPMYIEALWAIYEQPWLRKLEDWKPTGKGRDSLLRSLCAHFFAKYPMPQVLWSAFTEARAVAEELAPVVVKVAAGESFAKLMKEGHLPFPLTKKQCHAVMTTPSGLSFLAAVRRAQIQALDGGSKRLFDIYRGTRMAQQIGSVRDEAFWNTVLAFFAKNPMLDLAQLGPLSDYLINRRAENAGFSMKGRTPAALIRDMEEWHGQLARKPMGHQTYDPSGFVGGNYERNFRDKSGNYVSETWRVDEILTGKDLGAEGRAHKHCVSSYGWSIQRGNCSIWSMSHQGERKLTIEVRNQVRRVVQARGKYNRQSDSAEFKILNKWANENRLQVTLGQW